MASDYQATITITQYIIIYKLKGIGFSIDRGFSTSFGLGAYCITFRGGCDGFDILKLQVLPRSGGYVLEQIHKSGDKEFLMQSPTLQSILDDLEEYFAPD